MLNPLSFAFLKSTPGAVVTALLVIQTAMFYIAPTAEYVPNPPPLRQLQAHFGEWRMHREMEMDAETQSFLKADDSLNRVYVGPKGPVTLFVAFFRSQRAGVTPHSPKICLPGNGWTPEGSSVSAISVPGEAKPIPINRYIVRHGEERSLVLYWYATAHHTIANEYASKLYLMYEGLRYRRSDEAVYRVIRPIAPNDLTDPDEYAAEFIRAFYPTLKRQMWTE
jgi:EpsI family protein